MCNANLPGGRAQCLAAIGAEHRIARQQGLERSTDVLFIGFLQYLPKGRDLSESSQADLDAIAWKLNTRPRKSLGFKCPVELFMPDAFDFKLHHAALFALGA